MKVAAKICALPAPVRCCVQGTSRFTRKKSPNFINISSRNAATHHLNLQQSSLNVAVRYHVSRAYSFAKQLHFRKNVPPPSLEKNIAQKPTKNVSFFCLLRVVFTSFFTLRSLQRLHIPTKFNPNLPPVALMATSSHPKFVVVVYFFLNPPNSGNPLFDSRVKISTACVKKVEPEGWKGLT